MDRRRETKGGEGGAAEHRTFCRVMMHDLILKMSLDNEMTCKRCQKI